VYKKLYRGYDPRGFISTSATYGPLNLLLRRGERLIYNILFSKKKRTDGIVCEFSRRGDGHACSVKVRHRRRTLERKYDFSIHFTLFSYTGGVWVLYNNVCVCVYVYNGDDDVIKCNKHKTRVHKFHNISYTFLLYIFFYLCTLDFLYIYIYI